MSGKQTSAFSKHFIGEHSSDEEDEKTSGLGGGGFGLRGCKFSKQVLEIIDEDEKNRASSNDLSNVNEEVYRFLRRNDLEFLVEYFTGEYCKTTLKQLIDMTVDELVELFGGPLYVKRIRQELDKLRSS
jgi:hypothetical protein